MAQNKGSGSSSRFRSKVNMSLPGTTIICSRMTHFGFGQQGISTGLCLDESSFSNDAQLSSLLTAHHLLSNNWKNLIVLFVILSSLANSDEVAKFPFKINLHIFVEDDKTDSA